MAVDMDTSRLDNQLIGGGEDIIDVRKRESSREYPIYIESRTNTTKTVVNSEMISLGALLALGSIAL